MNISYNLTLEGHPDKDNILFILKYSDSHYEASAYSSDQEHLALTMIDIELDEEDAELVWSNDHPFFKSIEFRLLLDSKKPVLCN